MNIYLDKHPMLPRPQSCTLSSITMLTYVDLAFYECKGWNVEETKRWLQCVCYIDVPCVIVFYIILLVDLDGTTYMALNLTKLHLEYCKCSVASHSTINNRLDLQLLIFVKLISDSQLSRGLSLGLITFCDILSAVLLV